MSTERESKNSAQNELEEIANEYYESCAKIWERFKTSHLDESTKQQQIKESSENFKMRMEAAVNKLNDQKRAGTGQIEHVKKTIQQLQKKNISRLDLNFSPRPLVMETADQVFTQCLRVLSPKGLKLRSLTETDTTILRALAEEWVKENHGKKYILGTYAIELRKINNDRPNETLKMLDAIIDRLLILSFTNNENFKKWLANMPLQDTNLRHAIVKRIHERSLLPGNIPHKIHLAELLADNSNMLTQWLKTPARTGIIRNFFCFLGGNSTRSFEWLKESLTSGAKKNTPSC